MRFAKVAWIIGLLTLMPMFGCAKKPKPEEITEPPDVAADEKPGDELKKPEKPADAGDKK